MPIPPIPSRATVGRSSLLKSSAVITTKTMVLRRESFASTTSTGRFGTYEGGKEKAPAAICRKVALGEDNGEIEVWGDGEQTRSFMYVDDCVEGLIRIMASDYRDPSTWGTDEFVTINELVDLVARNRGQTDQEDVITSKDRKECAAGTATTRSARHVGLGAIHPTGAGLGHYLSMDRVSSGPASRS